MKLALCIPTWNRAQLLDYTLASVFDAYGDRVEVVVADNSSTDYTQDIVREWKAKQPNLRYVRHPECMPYMGQIVAMRNATAPYVAFLADDDWVRPNIFDYVAQLDTRPELQAIYSDLVAWDDDKGEELHRYFYLQEPHEFTKAPLDLVTFVCKRIIYPEIGVFRREAFLSSDVLLSRGNLPNHLWMYRMSRLGTVRFETAANAYYQENRVVKKQFNRTPTSNLTMRMGYIGDEFRNVLETMLLWAFQDAGHKHCPAHLQLIARQLIEVFLHGRLTLETQRACQDGDFILATHLANRLRLWSGATFPPQISMEAAKQAVEKMRKLGCGMDMESMVERYAV